MTAPRCQCGAPADHLVLDLPEMEHALMFGDPPSRRAVCEACLAELLADGPVDTIEAIA